MNETRLRSETRHSLPTVNSEMQPARCSRSPQGFLGSESPMDARENAAPSLVGMVLP